MERLTRTDISMAINILCNPQSGDESDIRKAVADAIEAMRELQHYKDLEEQGRLILLPCKVGDTVWNVNEYAEGFKIRPMEVESMTIKEGNKSIVYLAYSDKPDGLAHGYGFDDFGNIVFLTKEEAEAKVAELKK